MPIFNLSFFNAQNFFITPDDIPTPSTYSNIKLYGGGRFDNLHGESYIYDEAKIDSLDFYSDPVWTVPTFIMMLFNNNLQGGNIVSLPDPIDKWLLLRKGQNDAKATKIAELDAGDMGYIDRLAVSKEVYDYTLIPVAGDLLGESLLSDPIATDFTKVILLDPTETEGYSFCLDLSVSDIGIEEDLTVSDTKGKFQTILKGNKKVNSGNLSFIITSNADTYNELKQDVAFIDGFGDFILNGEEKILKFTNGFSYRVFTSDFIKAEKQGNDAKGNKVYVVSFAWREVGEL